MQLFFTSIFLLVVSVLTAQPKNYQPHRYDIIRTETAYRASIRTHPGKKMLNLKTEIPSLVIALRYAGDSNFTGKKIYPPASDAYLRRAAVKKLAAVQQQLFRKGIGLKIFDAYRPWWATAKIWELVKDERYAADPEKGSNHNRGIAVDCTIIDLENGKELNMGTGFDNFSDTAHHPFKALPDSVLENRLLLKNLMEKNGFVALETEWWHYSLPNAKDYEILNINFDALKKLPPQKK